MFSQIPKQIDAYLMARDLNEENYELETIIRIKDFKKSIAFRCNVQYVKIDLKLNESFYPSLIRRLKYFKKKRDKDNSVTVKDICRTNGNYYTYEIFFRKLEEFQEFYKKYIAGGTEINEKRKNTIKL